MEIVVFKESDIDTVFSSDQVDAILNRMIVVLKEM